MSDTVSTPERFVDDERAAEFLSLSPRRVKELARAGALPGYPLGDGCRRVWRFRLSDLAAAMERRCVSPLVYEKEETRYVTKPAKRTAEGK